MANVLFTGVRIFDGSGESSFTGEVLVQGNRIRRVARGARAIPTQGVTVIDAAGAVGSIAPPRSYRLSILLNAAARGTPPTQPPSL